MHYAADNSAKMHCDGEGSLSWPLPIRIWVPDLFREHAARGTLRERMLRGLWWRRGRGKAADMPCGNVRSSAPHMTYQNADTKYFLLVGECPCLHRFQRCLLLVFLLSLPHFGRLNFLTKPTVSAATRDALKRGTPSLITHSLATMERLGYRVTAHPMHAHALE